MNTNIAFEIDPAKEVWGIVCDSEVVRAFARACLGCDDTFVAYRR